MAGGCAFLPRSFGPTSDRFGPVSTNQGLTTHTNLQSGKRHLESPGKTRRGWQRFLFFTAVPQTSAPNAEHTHWMHRKTGCLSSLKFFFRISLRTWNCFERSRKYPL